jgi:hypothetical protein
MKLSYIASQTIDLPGTSLFKSWGRVVNSLEKAHYNSWEIEAIARNSYLLIEAAKPFKGGAPYTALVKHLANRLMTPGSKTMNEMVMKAFGKSEKLEYNDRGQVCERGTCPGNPGAGSTLVPIGTPRSCNPHSELYWSM